MRVTKKSSNYVIFFAVSRVSPSHAFTAKKKVTRRDDFFVTCIYRKKKLHDLTPKKITRCDDFFVTRIYGKKNLHDLPPKKITRCADFFLHTFTAKIKKLHDLTAKKELPNLLKMHACRQCAHLWATSDFLPALGIGDPRECRGDIALPPSSGPQEGRVSHFWFCPPLQGGP